MTLQQQNVYDCKTDTLGLSGMTTYQTRHSGASIDCAWRRQPPFFLSRSETSWKNSQQVEGLLKGRL